MENRPQGRDKNVTGSGKGVGRRGSGLGTGPVGNPGGYSGRPGGSNFNRPSGGSNFNRPTGGSGGSRGPKRGGGFGSTVLLLLALALGGGGAMSFFGEDGGEIYNPPSYSQSAPSSQQSGGYSYGNSGSSYGNSSHSYGNTGSSSSTSHSYGNTGSSYSNSGNSSSSSSSWGSSQGFDFSGLLGGGSSSSSGWMNGANTGKLNTKVDPAARGKYTQLKGNGKDVATVMVYMCGTDLESQSGMGTKDLQEMINATLGKNVNVIVYTGGCRSWRNNVVSSSVNQIYKVESGGLYCLEKNAGTGAMTNPKTLTSFIQYCTKNYPANRNFLILWDHGGGSISGYGYDEKAKNSGAMSLKGLDEALAAGKTKFDFIGFDACLMGSLETGLTMAPYADYLVASEETEPGLGWYYTNWLTSLSRNTSTSTLELGKQIADDFVSANAQGARGQKTTLSLVDLAELEKTVPADFKAFSNGMLKLLKNNGYKTVATARSEAREFSPSNKVDHVDLVHLALKLDTKESRALASTILSAVKYNKTSSNMTNAYGLSLYFPYQKISGVNSAVAAYNAIGLESAYSDCIRTFASLESSGQTAAGGHTSPMTTLSGQSYGGSLVSDDLLLDVLSQLFGGGSFYDRSLDLDATAKYISANRFQPDSLVWSLGRNGSTLHLSEEEWSLVENLELNVFVDDGEGYIDLGLDNTFDFNGDGDLIGAYDGSWLAIDGQNIAYYHIDSTTDGDSYTITGRVPVLLNGTRAELILVFDNDNPNGYIAGARTDYHDGETETVAKAITELTPGDKIDYLCDYYAYNGTYEDSYLLGEQHIYTGSEQISNVYINAPTQAAYRFTDLYQNQFWTAIIPE